jgi:hypothetical protein
MSGNDDAIMQQSLQFARLPLYPALDKESPPPVLLTLTAELTAPGLAPELALETDDDQYPRRPESPPMCVGTQGVHSVALRATPALDPHRLFQFAEVSRDIPMPPQT